MIEFGLGIIVGIFLTLIGLVIAAAAGPNDEFNEKMNKL